MYTLGTAADHENSYWNVTGSRLYSVMDSWLVSVHLAHTKRVVGHPSPGAAGPTAGTLTRLAMIATVISKSLRVETDHMSQTWNNTVCTRCGPDPELYWFIHVQQGWDAPKRNIFAAEARVTMGK